MRHRADQPAVLQNGAAAHALDDAARFGQQALVGDLDDHAARLGRVLPKDLDELDGVFAHTLAVHGAQDAGWARVDGVLAADGQAVGVERVRKLGGHIAIDAEDGVAMDVAQHTAFAQERAAKLARHAARALAHIHDVRKGARGVPGELRGSFLRESRVLGDIQSNTIFGVYGDMTAELTHPLYPDGLPIGRKDAVHAGPASILCTVDGEGMREYAVELVQVFRQNEPEPRSMIVEVTDERLLAKTGGIVQGMSGSPILQDGRLIGAVTHV